MELLELFVLFIWILPLFTSNSVSMKRQGGRKSVIKAIICYYLPFSTSIFRNFSHGFAERGVYVCVCVCVYMCILTNTKGQIKTFFSFACLREPQGGVLSLTRSLLNRLGWLAGQCVQGSTFPGLTCTTVPRFIFIKHGFWGSELSSQAWKSYTLPTKTSLHPQKDMF